MPLIQCPECNSQVSDKATSCPKCGHPVLEMKKSTPEPEITPKPQVTPQIQTTEQRSPISKKKNRTGTILGLVVLAAIVWGVVWLLGRQATTEVKKAEAFKNIQVTDANYHDALGGGITLDNITLANPTKYSFSNIRYQFYDVTDGSIKIADAIGPLMPLQTQKFDIDRHVEGLWEHKYGIRIVGGTVVE